MTQNTSPRPYIPPTSAGYQIAAAVYAGETVAQACERLGIKPNSGRAMLSKVRRLMSDYARQSVGRDVSDVFALRLLFEPGAEKLLRNTVRPARKARAGTVRRWSRRN